MTRPGDLAGEPAAKRDRRPARGLRIVLAAVGVLLAAELTVRAFADELPKPQLWSAPQMLVKEAHFGSLQQQQGGASVVFLGSSTMDAAADPSMLRLPAGTRPPYNAATGGGSMRMIEIWSRGVALPRLRPDVAVLGMVTRELNENDPEQQRLERDFLESKAVRRLEGTEDLYERLERHAEDISALFEYRSVLRQPKRVWDTVRTGRFHTGEFGQVFAPDGQYELFADGLLTDPRANVAVLRKTVTRDFSIGRAQIASLRRLLGAMREHAKHVVVVNMPVAQSFVDAHPRGAADYRRAVGLIRAEAEASGAQYVDVGVWGDRLMSDAGHVNRAGSQKFTRLIERTITRLLGAT